MLAAMKVATFVVSRPLSLAYTGPIEKMMAEIRPDTVTATRPAANYGTGRAEHLARHGMLGTRCATLLSAPWRAKSAPIPA